MSELISVLSQATGLSDFDLRAIISNAPDRYKVYYIAKRKGGRREIAQPARELKVLQRALNDSILSKLPVHPAAMAYRPGVSLRRNAQAHSHNGPILKFDFQDFFPSLRAEDWEDYCRRHGVFKDDEDIELSSKIMFRRKNRRSSVLRLAIGAPSSPLLSNILLFDFDENLAKYCDSQKITYTRYADDLTFSAKRTGFLNGVEKFLVKLIKDADHPRIKLNLNKTVLATKKYKRMVTGLILTNDGKVSLGQLRKRNMRAGVHQWILGNLSEADTCRLAGHLAFAEDIEPDFVARLTVKYGAQVIAEIKMAYRRRVL
ncbi:RNA-directed DNA polymerase [Rhizobium wenxiniae]|uniref:RNA-directed DNA polymerase n=1 Tax=Rhizobium wenxiniae TaxID=1737357 RepID=A0A7W9YBA3_9HYPH|nr:retron St85 family RNA-directed DNA polymerase [Rhizobium wenxiniae]MBB6165437.1 retron-type reverse transcriptase [Rhizobium wenxiniae]GGG15368.1 RNA-directed DNA polymerase [Rhizobium wenxiniae]